MIDLTGLARPGVDSIDAQVVLVAVQALHHQALRVGRESDVAHIVLLVEWYVELLAHAAGHVITVDTHDRVLLAGNGVLEVIATGV